MQCLLAMFRGLHARGRASSTWRAHLAWHGCARPCAHSLCTQDVQLAHVRMHWAGRLLCVQGRVPGRTGVWVGERKLGAVGVRISRGVATHGLALNVATDLRAFGAIVACGLADTVATSLQAELALAPASAVAGGAAGAGGIASAGGGSVGAGAASAAGHAGGSGWVSEGGESSQVQSGARESMVELAAVQLASAFARRFAYGEHECITPAQLYSSLPQETA